ncbi:MAG: TatD family hydrolase [Aggregatilineales bacterium]
MIRLVDTHCHLNFASYDDDRDSVIKRAEQAGVDRVIVPAIDSKTAQEALALAEHYPGIFAAVGTHPNSTVHFHPSQLDLIGDFARKPRVIAIGEIGLDYYWDQSPRADQIRAFEAQLQLAVELKLPVIIHNRDASEDVIAILEAWAAALPPALRDRPGVLHSFSASQVIAERALIAGFMIGFTGPVTFKNADELRTLAAATPLERVLIETDGPFLTPVPHRGRRNEPAYVRLIAERLAAVKDISIEAFAAASTANAERLFQIG